MEQHQIDSRRSQLAINKLVVFARCNIKWMASSQSYIIIPRYNINYNNGKMQGTFTFFSNKVQRKLNCKNNMNQTDLLVTK